jgi:hypothetical protein
MRKISILIFAALLVLFQTETVRAMGNGKVFQIIVTVHDGDLTRMLPGAKVFLAGQIGITDETGTTTFGVKKGTYAIRVEADNFDTGGGSVKVSNNTRTQVVINRNCNGLPDNSFNACYFDNSDLTNQKANASVGAIDFDWGDGTPDPAIGADSFSARFRGNFDFEEKQYEFSATGDDGYRVWVDDELIIDNWNDQAPTTKKAVRTLSAGKHRIVMEYYEGGGGAMAKLNWAEKKPYEIRQGLVRLNGRTLYDDTGEFNALGATLMSAARWYKYDRARLDRELKTLQEGGFHYIRALGVVAWQNQEIDPRWSDYAQVIEGVTDYAYDNYGIRTQWTIFGDAQVIIPDRNEQRRLVEYFVRMSKGREHKIILFEIANEYWQNGFGGDEGERAMVSFARYVNDNTPILVATSAGGECENFNRINPPGVTDVGIQHFDRDTSKTDGPWRPVRQPWEYQACNGVPGSNNEPIGPGSSVATDDDPMRMAMAAVTTYLSGLPFYVFHSRTGVGLGEKFGYDSNWPMSAMRGWDSYKNMSKYLPAGLSGWEHYGHAWAGNPLQIYGDGVPNYMTTDGAKNGCMRNYAAANGTDFVVGPIGCKGVVEFHAKWNMSIDIYHPLTGDLLQHLDLNSGQRFSISGETAWVIRGTSR